MGARPQIIKAAPLHAAIASRYPSVTEILVHTGQHYDYELSQIFFEALGLPTPDHHLEVGSGPHGGQTGEMLKRLEPVLADERPDVVVVLGDTNSTLAGALAATKLRLPVAHVEAGLRSGRLDMPEEVNRVVADHVSSLLFCPTPTALENVHTEGLGERAILSGDVLREVLDLSLPHAAEHRGSLHALGVEPGGFALATIHRAENTDDPVRLDGVMRGLELIAETLPVILPLHPRTRTALGDHVVRGVRVIPPIGHAEILCLLQHARAVITDSGGMQREAYWLGVPCVTPRKETEWVETLRDGWNELTDADPEQIARAAMRAAPGVARDDTFGGRDASASIVEHIVRSVERNTSVVP